MHRDSPPPLEYELVRSRRRSLEVRVRVDGSVQVRAPLKLAAYRVEAFVDSRRDWIRDQQQRMAARPRVRWRDGDPCQYLGELLTLRVAVAARARVARHGDELHVGVPDPHDEAAVSHAVHEWWRGLARTRFQESIEPPYPCLAARGPTLPDPPAGQTGTRGASPPAPASRPPRHNKMVAVRAQRTPNVRSAPLMTPLANVISRRTFPASWGGTARRLRRPPVTCQYLQ